MARFVARFAPVGLSIAACIAASPVVAVTTVTHTTTADFAAGTLGACYAGESEDGEVLLPPTEGTEFSGMSLDPGWLLADWNPPAGAIQTSVSGGVLIDSSARINRDPVPGPSAYGPGRSLEFVATFGPEAFQHVGFGGGDQSGGNAVYNGPPWVNFSTGGQTTFVQARVHNGATSENFDVHLVDGMAHHYRIDWTATQADWFVDGTLVHTNTTSPVTANMRPAVSDFAPGSTVLTVDWIRMTPYGTPCTFDSAVIDGGNAAASWTTLVANGLLPSGTAFAFETQTGDVPVPDGSWSGFEPVGPLGAIASPKGRYLQYRATLTTTDADETPELQEVSVTYDECTPSGDEVCGNAIDEDCDGVQTQCTPTHTPTVTPIPQTATNTVTATATATATGTHTVTATSTATRTATLTHTATATATPTLTPVPPTPTATATDTATPVNTSTATPALCGNGNVDAGEQCDDGNTLNGDCCDSTCHFEPAGAACNDHNTCTTGETCNSFGQCRGFTACNTNSTCDFCGSKCKLNAGVCKCGG